MLKNKEPSNAILFFNWHGMALEMFWRKTGTFNTKGDVAETHNGGLAAEGSTFRCRAYAVRQTLADIAYALLLINTKTRYESLGLYTAARGMLFSTTV